jgi:hypothetical protein
MTPPSSTPKTTEKWTIGALKEYFEVRFDGLDSKLNERFISQERAIKVAAEESDKRQDSRFSSQEKAIAVALANNDKRLDGMNELRGQLKDQAATFATRIELDALEKLITEKLDGLCDDVKNIQISDATLAGKASTWQVVVAWILAVVSILSRFIK